MRLLLIALVFICCSVHADEDSKQEKLIELVNVMDMDSIVEAMYSQMEVMLQDMSTEMGTWQL